MKNAISNILRNIKYLSFNSKDIKKNSMYFCLSGTKTNGVIYIDEAIQNGANAVVLSQNDYLKYKSKSNSYFIKVSQKNNNDEFYNKNIFKNIFVKNVTNTKVFFIIVNNVRKAMAIISAIFYDKPQKKLKIIGITGTNGKTSCSYLIANLIKSFGKKVGVIGTNGVFICQKKYDAHMTTPDSIKLFKIFAQMVKAKVEYCIMEVSAHAIFYKKIYGINFAVKCLTNVKSDHLDFFKTQKNYEKIKAKFFYGDDIAVINNDDKIGKKIAKKCKKCVTIGENNANFLILNKKVELGKTKFELKLNQKIYQIESSLTGKFNVYNLALSICVLQKLGFDIEQILKSVRTIKNIDGRFDLVYKNRDFNIIIDYAHTTDSLKNLLETIKEVSLNKNIIVFGCPGERDTTKRFLMGKLAGEFCDYVILTTDNPASENPKRIMFEIGEGVKNLKSKNKCFYIENRQKAIKKAIKIAKKVKKCNILIVGKGIENYQIIGDMFVKYSDYEVVKNLLKE